MFDAIVPLKRNGSWSTTPSWRRYERSFTLAEVDAVDAHRALVGVVEAADEPRERRLAAARLADEREAAARRHVDVDAVQHRLRAVREDDVVDREVALDARQLVRVGAGRWISGSSSRIGRDLHHRRRARLQLAVDVRELLQRLEHELQQVERRDRASRS